MKTFGADFDFFEAPWYLIDAINQAGAIVSILEQPEDWRPPQEIWHHSERINEFFERKKRLASKPDSDFSQIEHDPGIDNSEAQEYLRVNGLL